MRDFLTHLARSGVSANTQNQALAAIKFLYTEVIQEMRGTTKLMAMLLYGSGLRLMECCCLRVKDIDLDRRELIVRHGAGHVDLPDSLRAQLGAGAARQCGWQWLFAAVRTYVAAAAGLSKRVTCHTFRHSFAPHFLEGGYDIRTVRNFLATAM